MDNGKGNSEIFTDWKERSEMVAEACHWDEHTNTKLVNLVTRLCGQVNSFHRSCDGNQWSSYTRLMKKLTQHFTPVRIGGVQKGVGIRLIYDRWQNER